MFLSDLIFFLFSPFIFKCGRYILYYHNARRTVRLFKRDDGKSVANYCLHTEATSFLSTKDGNRWENPSKEKEKLVKLGCYIECFCILTKKLGNRKFAPWFARPSCRVARVYDFIQYIIWHFWLIFWLIIAFTLMQRVFSPAQVRNPAQKKKSR